MPRGHYDRSKAKPRGYRKLAAARANKVHKNASAIADTVPKRRQARKPRSKIAALVAERERIDARLKDAVGSEIIRLREQLEAATAMAKTL